MAVVVRRRADLFGHLLDRRIHELTATVFAGGRHAEFKGADVKFPGSVEFYDSQQTLSSFTR